MNTAPKIIAPIHQRGILKNSDFCIDTNAPGVGVAKLLDAGSGNATHLAIVSAYRPELDAPAITGRNVAILSQDDMAFVVNEIRANFPDALKTPDERAKLRVSDGKPIEVNVPREPVVDPKTGQVITAPYVVGAPIFPTTPASIAKPSTQGVTGSPNVQNVPAKDSGQHGSPTDAAGNYLYPNTPPFVATDPLTGKPIHSAPVVLPPTPPHIGPITPVADGPVTHQIEL